MSNQSYLSVWCKDFTEEQMLERSESFLATVPFSASMPGFSGLVVRVIDSAETPLVEYDLRAAPQNANGIIELAREYAHGDAALEVRTHWDLWTCDATGCNWKNEPQPLEIFCHGPDYDNQFFRESGHFMVDFGFEHVFTGHAGLLGIRQTQRRPAQSPEEARFLEAMAWPENLGKYQEKTRQNIRKLFDWVRQIEKAIPVERLRLWSEGEENFEARLEEILAVH
jgi:hypothetical protein